MKNVIFDTDGGGDDLWGLLLLIGAHKRGEIKLVGITTCYGNTSLENASNNILNFLHYCGVSDIPVYKGATRTLDNQRGLADGAFGSDGLSKGTLPKSDKDFAHISADEFLMQTLSNANTPISIIATGPATNIAKVFRDNPELDSSNIDIIWMGGSFLPCAGNQRPNKSQDGAFNRGNITTHMEFNAGNDVPASIIITNLKNAKVTIFPLDAGQHMDFDNAMQKSFTDKMEEIGKKAIADNMIGFLQDVIALDQMKQGMEGTPIFDAQTAQYFLYMLEGQNNPPFLPPVSLQSVNFVNKPEAVRAFLKAADAGDFAPQLLDTHGKMTFNLLDNSQISNIQILPGLYTIDESTNQNKVQKGSDMGRARANDLISRLTNTSRTINFS